MTRSRSFPPAVRSDCRLLVLGSLPGQVSLAQAQYYAHPRNQFWRLIGAVIGQELVALPYPDRLATLHDHRIGLWDSVGSAVRPGSLDADIRDVATNDLAALADRLPGLRAAAFNGGTSWRLGARQLAGRGLELLRLPSSSPAHAGRTFDEKLAEWLALRALL